MRKVIWAVIAGWLAASCFGWAAPGYAAASKAPAIHAKAAALIDVASGRLLYSRNGNAEMRIASTTKIMTAIVAIENGNLSDMVTVGPDAVGVEGSSIYLKKGEQISLENLLYGLMLRSGNDAAVAIADHVGGSVDGFVYMMNQEAQRLGLTHTHFANPNGLDAPDHYSSANDMAKLTAYALHNPEFREIVKTQVKTVPNPNPSEPWDLTWRNKNKLLKLYPGADGVKTGYTKLSRRCLVSSATRDGQQLAAVTLNDPDDWADHTNLLNYGFANFPLHMLIAQGQRLPGHDGLAAGSAFAYPLASGEEREVATRLTLDAPKSLDYRLGYRGELQFILNGRQIGAIPLLPASGTGAAAKPQGHQAASANGHRVQTRRHLGFGEIYRILLHRLFLDSSYE